MNEQNPSVLLVEDEENLHDALKLNLELEGYSVTSVMDGAAALKAVENEYFDLIIMDVMLPELDGVKPPPFPRLRHPRCADQLRVLPRKHGVGLDGDEDPLAHRCFTRNPPRSARASETQCR